MVIMDNSYSSTDTIWKNITAYHLKFLEEEESPDKIEIRIKLEDWIRQYLCFASHKQKFNFIETLEVLHSSALNKSDFSAYKAASGWNAIQLYAGNLLAQPWRREYKQIKTYSGFFKHQIDANLANAELMFQAMGYKPVGNGVLVLDGPICPDRVINVSLDCLIAYVECQILKRIWEEVTPTFSISWLEILDFREHHICSAEQTIKSLKYQYHQKQYQEHTRSFPQGNGGSDIHSHRTSHNSIPTLLSPSYTHINHSFPQHNMTPQQYYYPNNGCCASNYATPQSYAVPQYSAPIKPQFNSNGYYYSNGFVPQQPAYSVPTGQLIELESNGYDQVDRGSTTRSSHRNKDVYRNNTTTSEEDRSAGGAGENWDYVYKSLESHGYNKDLGLRGDVLSYADGAGEHSIKSANRKSKTTNIDEALNNFTLNEAKSNVSKKSSPASSYDNVHEPIKKTIKTLNHAKTKTLIKEHRPEISKTLQKTPDTKKKSPTPISKDSHKWECKSCTYLNSNSSVICEMCAKTRSNVDKPMEVGGAQCAHCTLVNPKEAKICQACNKSLKNSPTYI